MIAATREYAVSRAVAEGEFALPSVAISAVLSVAGAVLAVATAIVVVI